jgi:hypothetical protein
MSAIETYKDVGSRDTLVMTRISERDVVNHCDTILRVAIERVAEDIAKRYLADHAQEILSLMNQEAVANLAVADAAGAIREQLAKKLPDKIVEVVRTEREVYQRGVFGGMTRIR